MSAIQEPERFVYGSVLEALSAGLYPDKRHVIREFVQNAFDALREFRRVSEGSALSPIQVKIERPSVLIYDEGIGMTETMMRQYRYLGFSEKDALKDVGFRGIGKLSGVAVARQIIVTSSRLGVSRNYTVVIDAEGMLQRIKAERNPSLEVLLDEHSKVDESTDAKDSHYTLVELREIRDDSQCLYAAEDLAKYLRSNTPVPFDPDFPYAIDVSAKLKQYVPDYFECDLRLNGTPLYKPFPQDVLVPQFIPVFSSEDDSSPLMGFCWYAKNREKGQIVPREVSGLTYRVKNFAVGDSSLTRKDLWSATPERAYYFFGEIHLLDKSLVPSADRTNFEDNEARQLMFSRCKRISQQLNREAGVESAQRRFADSLTLTEQLVDQRQSEAQRGLLDIAAKPQVEFAIRKALEDVEKRLKRTEGKREPSKQDQVLIKRAKVVARKGRKLLQELERGEGIFFDVTKSVPMTKEAELMYRVTVEVLRSELELQSTLLERILRRLSERIQDTFR